MKKVFGLCILAVLIGGALGFFFISKENSSLLGPLVKPTPIPKPLLAYTFRNLKKDTFPATQIKLGRIISEDEDSVAQMFYYQTPAKPNSKDLKTVSGLANIPKAPGNYPVIMMFRGFVSENIYEPGIGTQPSAGQLVRSGYITLAPDFLGYGESDKYASDTFENRFQTYTTALSLFSSIDTLNAGLFASYSGTITADLSRVGLWAHSNGGHIALSTLAISGATYPTVLWAPVSTSFPYSILYYADESDDQGKSLRYWVGQFEKVYDTYDFSPERYYKWIKAPILINQGTADREVPYWWTEDLVKTLKEYNDDVVENLLTGADHNLRPTEAWNQAISATISFYNEKFGK